MHITPYQAVMLWDQLSTAYHGTNSYDGHRAEIYLSTCLEHSTLYAMNPNAESSREYKVRSCHAIHELCVLFQTHHKCDITVDGEELDVLLEGNVGHRIHLTVVPNDRKDQQEQRQNGGMSSL